MEAQTQMNPTVSARPFTTSVEDLKRHGFTAEQIEMLEALRAIYPMPEFLDNAERQRLVFVKWQREQGMVS